MLAAGSGVSDMSARPSRPPTPPPPLASGSSRLPLERVRVSCRTWARLRRLCSARLGGSRGITVRVRKHVPEGTAVDVVLELPDEMTVVLRGSVVGSSAEPDGRRELRIDLLGFDLETARRLMGVAASHGEGGALAAGRAGTDSVDTPL